MNNPKPLLQSTLPFVLVLTLSLVLAQRATAGTEHWIAVPGTSADTNWDDSANWTSPQQSYFNEVQFLGSGGSATPYVINNVYRQNTGPSQMPIWQLDMVPTNVNYTTLILPGQTLGTGAGNGKIFVGAGIENSATGPANAVETIAFVGSRATLSLGAASGSYLDVEQGSPSADSHMVTLDLSGLDTFEMLYGTGPYGSGFGTSSRFLLVNNRAPRGQGTIYLAKTNTIQLGNDFQIGNLGNIYSNSLPIAIYLGMTNLIQPGCSGAGNSYVVIGYTGCTNALMAFNPAFTNPASPPSVYFNSQTDNGRVALWRICNDNGGNASGYALVNLSGGYVNAMVDAMQLGVSGAFSTNALGVLAFDNGIFNVNNITNGWQQTSAGGIGAGIINVNSNATLTTSGTLQVNGTLTLGLVSGTPTAGTSGTLNVNGGTASVASVVSGGGASAINVTNGTFTLTGAAGTPSAPLTTVSANNSTLQFSLIPNTTNMVTASLATAGANTINIVSVPALTSFPVSVHLISYNGAIGGAGYDFSLGTLPPLCEGYISNDVANSAVDFVLTSGPFTLTWEGSVANNNWDTTTANWNPNGLDYTDGDFVYFLDGAATNAVDVTATFAPSQVTVSNSATPYIFNGSGGIGGTGPLVKEGTNALILDNTGGNTFSGGVIISSGSLVIGNNDFGGSLPSSGNIANSGSLVFNQQGSQITVPNLISGSGSIVQEGASSTVLLSGLNSYSGGTLVTSNSLLQVGISSALGSTAGAAVVTSGSTLDANGFGLGSKPLILSGAGLSGEGALISSANSSIYDSAGGLASSITLAGDTTLSFPPNPNVRVDLALGATLSTSNKPYNLTLNLSGGGYSSEWSGVKMDTNLNNINLIAGTWGIVGATTFGNTNSSLNIADGAGLKFYNSGSTNVNIPKPIVMQDGATIATGGGADTLGGPLVLTNLNGSTYCIFNIGNNTSLAVTNTISGNATLLAQGGSGTLTLSGNSPNFAGGVDLDTGTLTLNGTIDCGVTNSASTLVDGVGTAKGVLDSYGSIIPGTTSTAGTLTVGGLVLEGGALMTNNLTSNNTVGGGVNSLLVVNGDITPNNNYLYVNPLAPLANGTYTLITYTGALNGSFAGAIAPAPYTLTLNIITTTSPKQIQVTVSGGTPSLLSWNNAYGNGEWDVDSSPNWSNLTSKVSSDYFVSFDPVLFLDSITNSTTPTTSIDIASGVTVLPSVITNNSTTNYIISGAGQIGGSASLVKQGTSTLTISNANTFTGSTLIMGGTVVAATPTALGATNGAVTITNGGTLDLDGNNPNSGAKPIVVAGVGVNSNGVIVNNGGSAIYDSPGGLTLVTLATNATFGGGAQRWDLGNSGSGATLSTGGKPYSLSLTSSPSFYWEWDNVNVDTNLANIDILAGQLGIKGSGALGLGNPTNTVVIYPGAQLTFWGGSGFAKNYDVKSNATIYLRQAVPGVYNLSMTLENGANFLATDTGFPKVITGPTVLQGLVHFESGNAPCVFSNVISGAGGFYLNLYDTNGVTFTATNTYLGPTLMTNGGLRVALAGSGSISSSTPIYVASGSYLDASGRSDSTFTVASGQTLAGDGTIESNLTVSSGATLALSTNISIFGETFTTPMGTLTVSGAAVLQGNTVIAVGGPSTSSKLSALSITYGGTLTLAPTNALLAGDSFKLFSANSYNGSFSSISPATPGAGLAWNTNGLGTGVVSVVSAVLPVPGFSSILLSGNNVVLQGTNGLANGTYYLLTSTNVTLALSNWTVLSTNQFNASGNFSVTNSVTPGVAQRYYAIEVP